MTYSFNKKVEKGMIIIKKGVVKPNQTDRKV